MGGGAVALSGVVALGLSACADSPSMGDAGASAGGRYGEGPAARLPAPVQPGPIASEASITVEGRIVPGGVECPLLRIDGGGSATLQGSSAPAPGARVRVTGRWIERSTCQQGRTIQADTIEHLND